MKPHKAPWECIYAKENKSKCKSGKVPKSDQEYFEILCLCILQAGLSWGVVRKNWQRYRRGFYNFDISKLAKMQTTRLMNNPDVIRNPKKIRAIIHNAKEFRKIGDEYCSFSKFLKSTKHMSDKDIFKLLMKRFRHVGDYTAEFYLHCVGYRNDR